MIPICHIVGAGEYHGGLQNADRQNSLFIAADGGYRYLLEENITPDILIGDFDSGTLPATQIPTIIPLQKEKDDTDMFAAVRVGLEKGYRRFELWAGTGGREDHTIANIQTLAFIAKHGGIATLHGKDFKITALCGETMYFPAQSDNYISVFAHTDQCTGVSIKGLKYELDDVTLENTFPIGVSNEFIGKDAEISVKTGILLIYW